MESSTKQLVQEVLTGHEEAFERLVQPYFGPLYGFIFLLVRDRDMAEDVVQESFIKAWKHLNNFDTNQSFKTWLYTIAKHTAFDVLKKKKALPFSAFRDEEGELPFERELSLDPEVLLMLEREASVEELDQALAVLPVLYRALLLLVYREDYSLSEAATILGEPYNTVKSRHQRALQKLRAAYEEQGVASGQKSKA